MRTETQASLPSEPALNPWAKAQRACVGGLFALVVLTTSFITVVTWPQPHHRAMIGMAWGLILFWIGGCGLVMWRWRSFWCRTAARLPVSWAAQFVAGCSVLALLEEVVTTTLTNCAPLFGVKASTQACISHPSPLSGMATWA